METCAFRRTQRVILVVVFCLLKPTVAGTFAPNIDPNDSFMTGTYLSTGTHDSEETTYLPRKLTTSTIVFTGEAVKFDHSSTARLSDIHPSLSESEAQTESWTETNPDVSMEPLSSSLKLPTITATQLGEPAVLANITNAYLALTEDWQPPTEARTARDLTVTELTKPGINSTDVADSISHADSLHISTTVTRTLLSITSNSSFPYIEDTSSSETVPRTVTLGGGSTGVTHGRNYPDGLLSTESDHSSATSDDHLPMNATQGTVPRSEVPHVFLGTQYQTGQPNVTGPGFAGMADSTSPESSPSFTEFNSEANTTADSSTSGASYTDRSMLSPSVPPSVPPENSHAITSHHDSDTVATETVTGRVSTSLGDVEEPQTHMEETTISGLTTAPLAPSDVDTTVQESFSKFLFGQQSFVPPTDHSSDGLTTASGPQTQRPQNTEEGTNMASTIPVASTRLASTSTAASITTQNVQPSTTALMHIAHTTLVITDTTQVLTTPTTEQYAPTSRTATPLQHPSSSQPGDMGTDVNTPHQETSTATPGTTTKHTTAFYTRSTPARTTAVVSTGRHTVKGPTEKETTTTQMSLKSTPSPDVDECVSNPCPQDSVCVNTRGSFNCECALGYDLEDGRSCTQAKTFLGMFSVNSPLYNSSTDPHVLHREILQLLNASLSILHGYRRSTLRDKDGLHIMNMFSMSANVTTHEVNSSIQMSLKNCGKPQSVCSLHQRYQLTYQTESLCLVQKNRCDTQYSVCNDTYGTPYCQCQKGYFKKNPEDTTCRDCGDGFELFNGTCVECTFGFGGFNCNNFYGLIAKVVSPAAGGFLLLVIIALIVTCCRKDKNDINKIIFKSGDLQMSPYPEFPKSSRVSLEWGRETIEMQENGSTKNLLQMTDIYYSPALRNADLERNGLYPFSGLPGSRHSCIYPAQWNPSFISDDSRRRDYF
ncbi:protein HEG isoform X2 [Electrophorus electricus]|uniref:protein HEG isoform X2 n=1 Tax=Electrophorus electricus TaxID=8005 RepID=UPI0015D01484|nr:protein HEG isoform X2 [Electrophorus electricus]